MKLTPWYPGHVKPVRVGEYQRKHGPRSHQFVYSIWDGKQWLWLDDYWMVESRSAYQSLPWRGIAKEQK